MRRWEPLQGSATLRVTLFVNIQGGVGRAIASLAVVFLGISAFFGKATWGMALLFAAGIFAIFGSGEIVAVVTNGYGGGC